MTPSEILSTETNNNIRRGMVVVGGVIGFSVGIYAAVMVVQPQLASAPGISSVGASVLTAVIYLCGGADFFISSGAAIGSISTPIVVPIVVAGARCFPANTCSFRFFGSRTSTQTAESITHTSDVSPLHHELNIVSEV